MRFDVLVIADFVCPWCYVGERRLAEAIAGLPEDIEVVVHRRPFELNPSMPAEGVPREEYRIAKFGSLEKSLALDANLQAQAAPDGITFNFDLMRRTPNSRRAHELMLLAQAQGLGQELADQLYPAYFTEGRDIGDPVVLIELAVEAGLSRDDVEKWLESREGAEIVAAMEEEATKIGVQGVPFFGIGRYGIPGAYPADSLRDVILKAARESAEEA